MFSAWPTDVESSAGAKEEGGDEEEMKNKEG